MNYQTKWHKWFAWYPVRLEDGCWAWLTYVMQRDGDWLHDEPKWEYKKP